MTGRRWVISISLPARLRQGTRGCDSTSVLVLRHGTSTNVVSCRIRTRFGLRMSMRSVRSTARRRVHGLLRLHWFRIELYCLCRRWIWLRQHRHHERLLQVLSCLCVQSLHQMTEILWPCSCCHCRRRNDTLSHRILCWCRCCWLLIRKIHQRFCCLSRTILNYRLWLRNFSRRRLVVLAVPRSSSLKFSLLSLLLIELWRLLKPRLLRMCS